MNEWMNVINNTRRTYGGQSAGSRRALCRSRWLPCTRTGRSRLRSRCVSAAEKSAAVQPASVRLLTTEWHHQRPRRPRAAGGPRPRGSHGCSATSWRGRAAERWPDSAVAPSCPLAVPLAVGNQPRCSEVLPPVALITTSHRHSLPQPPSYQYRTVRLPLDHTPFDHSTLRLPVPFRAAPLRTK